MKVGLESVRFAEAPDTKYEFDMPLPESLDEASEIYGEDNALWLLNSGLKVKLQNVAREGFRSGKSREEAEEAVRAYRPGVTSRKGVKARALELITEQSDQLKDDPELKENVMQAFIASNFKEVVALLEGE